MQRMRKYLVMLMVLFMCYGCAEYKENRIDTNIGEVLILHNPEEKDNDNDWGEVTSKDNVDSEYVLEAINIMKEQEFPSLIITAEDDFSYRITLGEIETDKYQLLYNNVEQDLNMFSCDINLEPYKMKCSIKEKLNNEEKEIYNTLIRSVN